MVPTALYTKLMLPGLAVLLLVLATLKTNCLVKIMPCEYFKVFFFNFYIVIISI